MTKSGIERDLKNSPYITTINYGKNCITYVFSSMTAKTKFEDQIEAYRKEVTESLTNRFRIKFFVGKDLSDVNLYRKIERRGFLIVVNGDDITWLGEVEYNGLNLCKKNSLKK